MMSRTQFKRLAFLEIIKERPFDIENVIDMVLHLASFTPKTPLVWEISGYRGKIKFVLGVDKQFQRKICGLIAAHGGVKFAPVPQTARMPVTMAHQVKISKASLALNTNHTLALTRAAYAALLQTRGNERTVIQLVLGPSYSATPVPHNLPDPHASWLNVAFGNVENANADARSAVKEKISSAGFSAVLRIGACGTSTTAPAHIYSIISALRTLNSAGVTLQTTPEKPENLNFAKAPWSFPIKLSVKEAASLMLLPCGELPLPGVKGLHPREIDPPSWYRNPLPAEDRTFALSLDGKTKISISPKNAATEHCHVLGATGSGKSTVLQNMALSHIHSGSGCIVIDQKNTLCTSILERFPSHRDGDLVVIDPSASYSKKNPAHIYTTGFNPLLLSQHQNPDLAADSLLAVLKNLYSDSSWGVYTQRILSHAIATLTATKGATLLWLVPLLSETNPEFRRKITAGIKDPSLRQFWIRFEAMSEMQKQQQCAPVTSKLERLFLRPGLRHILNQGEPSFNLGDIFTKKRVVLVALNSGVVGDDAGYLLGSLLISAVWGQAMAQARLPESKRQFLPIIIDELQCYVHGMGTDFENSLAMARGLNIGIVAANQHLNQLPPNIRSGLMTNARSKVCFGLVDDAKTMAGIAPGLKPEDFAALPRFHTYVSTHQNGRATGWFSAKTLPMSKVTRDPKELQRQAMERYGRPIVEVEKEYTDLLAQTTPEVAAEVAASPIGRRKKS